jgi:hypothetical protein
MGFLFDILKDEKFYNNLLTLLVSALKSESFMNVSRQIKIGT